MQLSGFDLDVWAATFIGHILLLYVLWTRRRAASFPVFTTLIASSVAKSIALYFILHHFTPLAYFYSYWSMAVVDEVLQLFVVCEIASKVFRPTGEWARDVRKTIIWIVLICIAVAMFMTWLASPATRAPIQAVVIRGNFFASALMSELFAGMMVLSATAGLPWKTHVARIAQGLGAYSMICVGTGAAANYFGVKNNTSAYAALAQARILGYLACLGYWIITLWQEAPAPRELPEAMHTQIYKLQRRVEYNLAKIRTWGKN
jgi:hypothetical protein